jgi:hypothetical protein
MRHAPSHHFIHPLPSKHSRVGSEGAEVGQALDAAESQSQHVAQISHGMQETLYPSAAQLLCNI